MKDRIVLQWYGCVIQFLIMALLTSCMKSEDILLPQNDNKRLIETLILKNGINYSRDQYQYRDGKLCMRYSYMWSDDGKWEKRSRTIYKCWPGNFFVTEYARDDSNWSVTAELWAKFDNTELQELTRYAYNSEIMQMQAYQKCIYSYKDGKLTLCESQSYEDLEWHSFLKTENSYNGDQLTETRSFNYHHDKWILKEYSEIVYDYSQLKEINNYTSNGLTWELKEKHQLRYFSALLSSWSCFIPDTRSDPMHIDYSTAYEYDDHGILDYECCNNRQDVIEKFYTYEDSCGNYNCTLGEICSAQQFPLQLPGPL